MLLFMIQRNTYQVVVTTNGMQTFVMFNYPRDGLQWSGRTLSAVVGYTSHDASFFQSHYLSGYPEVVNIASQQLPSNVGTVGRLFYRLSEDNNICASNSLCLSWYFNDIEQEGLSLFWSLFLPPCPCTLFQAEWDWRYQWQNSTATSVCYVSTFVSVNGAQTECCYSLPQSFLFSIGGVLLTGSPQGGTANRYHSSSYPTLHYQFDMMPFEDCCVNTDMCHLYYQRRPSQGCFGYVPPFWGQKVPRRVFLF